MDCVQAGGSRVRASDERERFRGQGHAGYDASRAARRPAVVSDAGQAAFEARARSAGLDPANRWVGGYVDYEWEHLRPIVEALPTRLSGLRVLEFGCNVGASAIVCARLGAQVDGVDVSQRWIELARLNAERFGETDIRFTCVAEAPELPFPDGHFDLVICNSVLEYVDPAVLPAVQSAIDRVLRPGGMILVTGTSNRLWPRDHTGNWLTNYIPRSFDRVLGRSLHRGLWPHIARYGFGSGYVNLDSPTPNGPFMRWKRAVAASPRRLSTLGLIARLLRVGPGLLAGSIFCVLLKPARALHDAAASRAG